MATMKEIQIPILIVGGGGCGLTASSMLSDLGIKHVLVESHAGTSLLPKAHVLNQRTAEILDQYGIWEKITLHGCPPEEMKNFRYSTGLGGDGPLEHYTLGTAGCFGCNSDKDGENQGNAAYIRDSAYLSTNLPLIRLEPILRDEAETRNPGRVLFNHTATDFKEEENYVVVNVIDRATNEMTRYVADYVIAADGGRFFGPALGIELEGPGTVGMVTTVYFKANLSEYWRDGDLMNWMVSIPDENSKWMTPSGLFCADWSTIVKMGPTWTKHSEEWALHFSLGQLHCPLETLTDEDMKLWTRKTLKLPNLELEILKTSRWNFEGVFAKQYQTNRIFLAGDAVHRHPPTTGLGLNTAIGDAHNLTWKLAAVLRGQAPPSFLKSYETERQPIGKRNTQWALHTLMSFRQIDTAVCLLPGGKDIRPVNEGIFNQMLADTFDGLARRAAFQYAIGGQRIEYAAHDLEIGGVYENGALVPDGTSAPPADPLGQRYDPSTRPGHRLPHAWLRGAHTRISTHHLLSRDGTWALLTDDSAVAEQWVNAAAKMRKRHSLKIVTARIGPNGDYKGEDEQWTSVSELEPAAGGMVLVRPDAYVAFRVKRFSAAALEQFEDAIVAILAIESTK